MYCSLLHDGTDYPKYVITTAVVGSAVVT